MSEEKTIEPEVILQRDDFFIINKPSGWIVNDASTTTNQPVLQAWLRDNLSYPLAKSHEFRSGIVHRLDKETSGVLIVAKNEKAFVDLQHLFKERKVHKHYIALLHGRLKNSEGKIEAEVGRLPWNRRRFGVLSGGRGSVTNYKLDKVYRSKDKEYSLVDFYPLTGRTHQIRIHAKHLGHPIVGDTFYAGRKTSRADRLWCNRLFLHAAGISFQPAGDKKIFEVHTSLPSDLENALATLMLE